MSVFDSNSATLSLLDFIQVGPTSLQNEIDPEDLNFLYPLGHGARVQRPICQQSCVRTPLIPPFKPFHSQAKQRRMKLSIQTTFPCTGMLSTYIFSSVMEICSLISTIVHKTCYHHYRTPTSCLYFLVWRFTELRFLWSNTSSMHMFGK